MADGADEEVTESIVINPTYHLAMPRLPFRGVPNVS